MSRERPIGGVLLAVLISLSGIVAQTSGAANKEAVPPSATSQQRRAQSLFESGEANLRAGDLDAAERAFRQVLAIDSNVAGAWANLGVIHMRHKQWREALTALRKAEKLAPAVAGIRLNIGLVFYRQGDYAAAIRPLASVLQQIPDSYQARYLLGICYFVNSEWTQTVSTLEPLWGRVPESEQFNYLYVLGRAAEISKNLSLEEKAYARLAEIGQGTPELRLIMGKAHLNRGEDDDAVRELESAAAANPKLPLVHYYLGIAYAKKQDFEKARAEFQKDLEFEPDAAFTYEQLGKTEATLQDADAAEKSFRQAIKLDSRSMESRMGLAKIFEQKKQYADALVQLEAVLDLNKQNAAARYLRGQVLVRMGREKEGRAELTLASKMLNEQRAARHKELEAEPVSSPELTREPH